MGLFESVAKGLKGLADGLVNTARRILPQRKEELKAKPKTTEKITGKRGRPPATLGSRGISVRRAAKEYEVRGEKATRTERRVRRGIERGRAVSGRAVRKAKRAVKEGVKQAKRAVRKLPSKPKAVKSKPRKKFEFRYYKEADAQHEKRRGMKRKTVPSDQALSRLFVKQATLAEPTFDGYYGVEIYFAEIINGKPTGRVLIRYAPPELEQSRLEKGVIDKLVQINSKEYQESDKEFATSGFWRIDVAKTYFVPAGTFKQHKKEYIGQYTDEGVEDINLEAGLPSEDEYGASVEPSDADNSLR